MSPPLYDALPDGPTRDAVVAALHGTPIERIEVADGRLPDLTDRSPGVVLVDPSRMTVQQLASSLPEEAGWTIGAVETDPLGVRPVSIGKPDSLRRVAAYVADPEGTRDALLDEQRIRSDVARARHDINNPLTSALAETQLLLLDYTEGETAESLGVIQAQLRRIRDLVAATGHIRPPRKR